MVNIGHLVGLAGGQFKCEQLGVSDGKAESEIETIDHGFEGVGPPIHLDDCAELPVGFCHNGGRSREGIDLVHARRNKFMSSGRRRRVGINRVRVESCIQLSGNSVETLVAEIERAVTVKGQRNVWIRWHAGVRNRRGDSARRVNGVEIVAEISEVQLSTDFGKSEGVEPQSGLANDRLLARRRIDFHKIPCITAGSCKAEQRTVFPPHQIAQAVGCPVVDRLELPVRKVTPRSNLQGFFGALYPVYVRGEAYREARQGTEAIAEFQKILDHRGTVISDVIGALAHLQLGRAYAATGDKAKAKSAYQDFLNPWKDADPDIPVLKQARTEYTKFQ